MVTKLKRRIDGTCYCAHCMMQQRDVEATCFYCGYVFSNYEDVLREIYMEAEEESTLKGAEEK